MRYGVSFLPDATEKTKSAEDYFADILAVSRHAEAVAVGDQHLGRYLDIWADAAKAWDTTTSSDYPKYTGFGHALKIDSPESMRKRLAAVVGSPATALRQIEHIREQVDPDVFLWQVDTGVQSAATAMTTLDCFANEVRPHVEAVKVGEATG